MCNSKQWAGQSWSDCPSL